MPVGFCFIRPDKENEQLSTIDDKIAEFFGEKPDEKYAPFMDMASNFGIGVLMVSGGSDVNEQAFNNWLANVQTKEPDRYKQIIEFKDGKLVDCLRKFLYQDYTFRAWR